MRTIFLLFFAAIFLASTDALADSLFDANFSDETMRIDYVRTGDAKGEVIAIDKIYRQGIWAGSTANLIDRFNNGRNYVHVTDAVTGELLFSKGFDSLFGEYQSTEPAMKGVRKAYHESVLIPCPKKTVRVAFYKRDRSVRLAKIFESAIDPGDASIIREPAAASGVKVVNVHVAGDPHQKADIAILGEGYTKKEFGRFRKDLKYFTDVFLGQEPYASLKDSFNIYGVFRESEESGADEPTAGIYKKTALNSSFNTLGSERYLMTEDNKAMRDMAAGVPYDALYIMVNHKRYGGGGIYNQFCVFTTGGQWKEYLFVHEFGHHFAGLADEYYTSAVSYNDMYPKGIEPAEPNITALLDSKNLKWNALLTEGVELPTPWEKDGFDKMDVAWQAERAGMVKHVDELKKARAPEEEIEKADADYNAKDKAHNLEIREYFAKSRYKGVVGAFEGAGYSSKGLYRPQLNCIMFSRDMSFCRVCSEAIQRVAAYLSGR